MTTSTPHSKLHPVLWVAAVAVIGFSAVGIAAITGVIPTAGGHEEIRNEARMAAAEASGSATLPSSPTTAAQAEPPAAAHEKTPPATRPAPVARRAPVREEAPVARAPQPAPAPICANCGVIESIRSVEAAAQGSGVGVIAGGVLGGVLGNQIGKGSGRDLATIGGAVLGGIAGNQVEKKVRSTTQYEVAVRLDSGERSVVRMSRLPAWREGDRVALRDGTLVAPDQGG